MSSRWHAVLCGLVAASAAPSLVWAGSAAGDKTAIPGAVEHWRTETQSVAPLLTAEEVVSSPDGRRSALLRSLEGGWVVEVDGHPGQRFDEIRADSLSFSPDGKRVAYEARRGEKWYAVFDEKLSDPFEKVALAAFSSDGNRTAFIAMRSGKWEAIVDGKAQGSGVSDCASGCMRFGPNGQHIVVMGSDSGRWFALLDGKRIGPFDALGEGEAWSADGKRFAFRARRGKEWMVVADGAPGPKFDGTADIVFSGDGRRMAYAAQRGNRWSLVVDRRVGPLWDEIRSVVFGLDGKHIGYLGRNGSKWSYVVDGKTAGVYEDAWVLKLDSEAGRVTCIVRRGNEWQVIADETVVARYGRDSENVIAFIGSSRPLDMATSKGTEETVLVVSPDGKRTAGLVRNGNRVAVLIDGRSGGDHEDVDPSSITFSKDSRHLVYKAKSSAGWSVVLDGELQRSFSVIFGDRPTFQPDGSVRYLAGDKGVLYRVQHGLERL